MMELFKKLSSQEKMFLYAAVAAGVVAFFDLLFYRPVTSRLRQIEEEIRKSSLAIEQDVRFISYEDKIFAEQEIFGGYQTGEKKTGEEIIAEFLGTVEGLAKKTAVNLSKITPSDVVPKKGAVYYFANLEADGRLEDVIRFMHEIDSTNNLLKIVKVNMEGNKAAQDAVKTSMKIAKLVIDPKTIGNYEFKGDDLSGPEKLKAEDAKVKKPDELKNEKVKDPTAPEAQKDGASTDQGGAEGGEGKEAGGGQNQGAKSGAGGAGGEGSGGAGAAGGAGAGGEGSGGAGDAGGSGAGGAGSGNPGGDGTGGAGGAGAGGSGGTGGSGGGAGGSGGAGGAGGSGGAGGGAGGSGGGAGGSGGTGTGGEGGGAGAGGRGAAGGAGGAGGAGSGAGGRGDGGTGGVGSAGGTGGGAGTGGAGSAGRERAAAGSTAGQAQNNAQGRGGTQGSGGAGGSGGGGLGGGGTGNINDVRPDDGTMGRSGENDFSLGRDNLEPDQPEQEMSPAARRKLQQLQQQQVRTPVSGKPKPLNKYQENLQAVKSGGRARVENFESLFTRWWNKVTGKEEELQPVEEPQPLELEYDEEEGDDRNLWERKISP